MKSYEQLGQDIGRLVSEKQAAYGDSFGKSGQIMSILYPQGIPLDKMDDALTVVRVLDKLFRIATDRDALGESPWQDIAGYSLLSLQRITRKKEAPSSYLSAALRKAVIDRLNGGFRCRVCEKETWMKWTDSKHLIYDEKILHNDGCAVSSISSWPMAEREDLG